MTIIYFAGADDITSMKMLTEEGVEDLLISYYYSENTFRDLLKIAKNKKIFLDSGAFSALSKGKPIDVHKYKLFLKKNKECFTTYANLDVIGNAEDTLKNQKILEAAGLHPLPAYHQGEPLSYLREYCKKYKYVAIGGMVGKNGAPLSKSDLERFLMDSFRIANHYKTKIHGFGLTNFEFLKKFNFYSCDSTSWRGSRHQKIYEFDEANIKMKSHDITPITIKRFNILRVNDFDAIDRHNIREWLKASVVFQNLKNNKSKKGTKEYSIKLSQKKIGNMNAVKTGKFIDVDKLSCDLCKNREECPKCEDGAICFYEKDISKFVLDNSHEGFNKFIKERLEKNMVKLSRCERSEIASGGVVDPDSARVENQIIKLIETKAKLEEV